MQFLGLPPELILTITTFLPESSILSLLLCSRALHSLLLPQLHILDLQRTRGTRQLFHHIRHNLPVPDLAALCSKHNLSIHATSEFTDTTALHVAVYYQRKAIIKWLLEEQKADPNAKDDFGFTPLHVAGAEGYADGAGCLLNAGADADVQGGGTVGAKAVRWRDLGWVRGKGRPWFRDPKWPEFV